jgi:thiosulfate/3-mercaptopyruvate sulfurtransferase
MAATSRSLSGSVLTSLAGASRRGPAPATVRAVTPSWLEARLTSSDLRILDVRADDPRGPAHRGPSPAYVKSHVPGAVSLDVRAVLFDQLGDVVSAPELALAMSGLGVGDGHTIVIVDAFRADTAAAAVWALARYGHTDVHVLEGGFARWIAEGREVSREILRHPPASFTAKVSS